MTIIPATVADLEDLSSLVNAAYRAHGRPAGWTSETELITGSRTNPASVRAMLERGVTILLLRLADYDSLCGCVAVEPHTSSTWHISMLAIDPGRQASGLGSVLLTAAEKYATARGGTLAHMTVIQARESLIAWYERHGYRRTGETEPFPYGDESVGIPLRADLHFVVLEKSLPEPN